MNGIFEGIEKRVIIKLKEDFFKGNNSLNSFLDIPKELWEEKLKYIGCSVVSEISENKQERRDERCRVYLLSESSLYIFDNSLFIKTCGKTRVLFFIPFVVDLLVYQMTNVGIIEKNCVYDETFIEKHKFNNITEFIEKNFDYCFFTHMNYRNKTKDGYYEQEYPHKSIDDEKNFFQFFFKNIQMFNTHLPMDRMHYIFFSCSDNANMKEIASTFKFCSEIHMFGIKKYNEKKQFHDAYLNKKSLNLFTSLPQDNLKLYDSDSEKELSYICSTDRTYEDTVICSNSSISDEKNRNAVQEEENDDITIRDEEDNKVVIKMVDTNLYECMNDNKESFLYNEFYFTPYGYSCNVSDKNNYFCVHYSPEDLVSYVSVEVSSNVSCDGFLDFMKNQLNFYNAKYMYMINYIFCEDTNKVWMSDNNKEAKKSNTYEMTNDHNNNSSSSSITSCFDNRWNSFYYNLLHEKEEYYYLNKKLRNDLFMNSKQSYKLHTFTEQIVGFLRVQYFVYELRDVARYIEKETLLANSASIHMCNRKEESDIKDDYITIKLSDASRINKLTEKDVDDMYEYALNFCRQNKIAILDTDNNVDGVRKHENSMKRHKVQIIDEEKKKENAALYEKVNDMSSLDHFVNKNNVMSMYYDDSKYIMINKDDENSTIATKSNTNSNNNDDDNSCSSKNITVSRSSSCNKSHISNSSIDNSYGNEKMKYACADEKNIKNDTLYVQKMSDAKNCKENGNDIHVNVNVNVNVDVNVEVDNQNNMEKKYKEEIFNYYEKNIIEVQALEKVLKEDIDTSVVCINLQKILAQYIRFKKNLPHVTPFYSVKSNNDEVVIKFLYGLNCNFDCASIGEIKKVIRLLPNISRDRIIFANTIKSINSLIYARKENINLCTFDNIDELKKIYKYHPKCSLILRINVDFKNYKSYMSSKYGANEYEWEEMLLYAKEHNLNIVGVSFHVGSNTKNLFDFCLAIKLCRDVFDMSKNMGFNFYIINLGGGYPEELEYDNAKKHDKIHYCTLSLNEIKKDIENFLNEETFMKTKYGYYSFEKISLAVNMSIDHYFSHMKNKLKVICEPGRYMVAASSTLAVKIIGKRHPTFKGIMLKDLKDHYDPLNFAQQEIKKEDKNVITDYNNMQQIKHSENHQGGDDKILNKETNIKEDTTKMGDNSSSQVNESVSCDINKNVVENKTMNGTTTVDGNDNIKKSGTITVDGNDNIKKSGTITMDGNDNIKKSGTITMDGNDNIKKSGTITMDGNDNIKKSGTITMDGNDNIKKSRTITIGGNDNIKKSGTITMDGNDNIKKSGTTTVDDNDNINIAHKNIGNNFSSSNSKLGNITNIKKKVVNINDNRYNYFSYYVSDSIYGCFSGIIFDEYNRCPIYVIKNKNNPNQNFMNFNLYLANVFGQSCDGLDMINSITYLPECYINDWLLYEYAGAYTFVSSSNFNGFKKCQKVYIFPQSKPYLNCQPNKLETRK
ncbi:S-adenosylmethionine decarboxylase/ornithine decarboxylase [Plasmodium sp. gorilla clade G2]|uniref:S-adenosylmethionine decarboxylase/ornithine decarboxylase n=1 Tax=Plasmodium sp. gorilla clade G2 TaxID=880535 RepID=UPI000D217F82|nr:S-adenosylmethionine decarboxylase/ornithine decarboxylase [Plasmodium sp. gorilla clade G2]SOV15192.1 S-adenosylmethionine decarboxylase/ornithine decarboxylase [Plasmodium sp. gorilla clade G2]